LLKKLIVKKTVSKLKYSGIDTWRPPLNWTNTTNSGFYGDYVRSAYYIKSGTGDQKATWVIPIKDSGHYDIFAYINPNVGRSRGFGPGMGMGGRQEGGEDKGEYHFTITHEDGVTEQTMQIEGSEAGWISLGSFYLSPEKAKIVLSNLSAKKLVFADAIKVVKN
jgi:hypothetical protein